MPCVNRQNPETHFLQVCSASGGCGCRCASTDGHGHRYRAPQRCQRQRAALPLQTLLSQRSRELPLQALRSGCLGTLHLAEVDISRAQNLHDQVSIAPRFCAKRTEQTESWSTISLVDWQKNSERPRSHRTRNQICLQTL